MEVESDPLLEIGHIVSATHLPETGQARLHAQASAVGHVVKARYLVDRQRAWAHQAHLSAENIPKLRQLVDRPLAQEPTHGSHARIVGHLKHWPAHLVELG